MANTRGQVYNVWFLKKKQKQNRNSRRSHSLLVRGLLPSPVAVSRPVSTDQIGTTKKTPTSNTLEIYYPIKMYAQRRLSSRD